MKKAASTGLFLLGILIIVRGVMPVRYESRFNLKGFARLPVFEGGRLKPLDTAARSSLLILRGKQTFLAMGGEKKTAIEWLAEAVFHPELARARQVFRIDHPEVLALMDLHQDNKKYFSWNDLTPCLQKIGIHAGRINSARQAGTPCGQAILKLHQAILLYQGLAQSFHPPGMSYDETALDPLAAYVPLYEAMAETASIRIIPPRPGKREQGWKNLGGSLLDSVKSGGMDETAFLYAKLAGAYRAGAPAVFNQALEELKSVIEDRAGPVPASVHLEYLFNSFQPFLISIQIYVLVFLAVCFSWLMWPRILTGTAFRLLLLAVLAHSLGLLGRMVIQGRPPVTNLYSSAVFVGWGAVVLCLFIEYIHRDGTGSFVAAAAGFLTLLIAHHLAAGGDTMEMMRAVLDSNFWLATHVTTIALGYSAAFLAGGLGVIYLLRGLLTRSMDEAAASSLADSIYGTVCFALLFSFLGTVLGGIWADQSWGRFWGWDPKENGALMVVIWNALILHAWHGGMAGRRGLAMLAVGGNIVTSWSWFGTNMLGVGLHAYGFMSRGFLWLLAFWLPQAAFIAAGFLHPSRWRSPAAGHFRPARKTRGP